MTAAGLVLAAGEGRRFGGPKALVRLDGERLVDRAVRVLGEAGCAPVVVVAGAAPLAVPGADVVDNPDWRTGMGSSLRAGLAALAERPGAPVSAAAVLLVDLPGVGAAAVRRLLDTADGRHAIVATYGGAARHPVVLPRAVWPEVAAAAVGDRGARAWLAARPDRVVHVECGDVASPLDVDRPADLPAARRG